MGPTGPLDEIFMDDSEVITNSDINASKDNRSTDSNSPINSHGYQDPSNNTDGYSSRDDYSYHTDEDSNRQHKPENQAVETNRVTLGYNEGVASRFVRDSTNSSVRSTAFSLQDRDINSINLELNQCTQSLENCPRALQCPATSVTSTRPPTRSQSSSKSIRRGASQTLKRKIYKASWMPSSDEDN